MEGVFRSAGGHKKDPTDGPWGDEGLFHVGVKLDAALAINEVSVADGTYSGERPENRENPPCRNKYTIWNKGCVMRLDNNGIMSIIVSSINSSTCVFVNTYLCLSFCR